MHSRTKRIGFLSALAVGMVAVVTSTTPAAGGASEVSTAGVTPADTVVLNEWNLIAQTQAIAIRPTAHGQARGIAMVQGAVYDAVNAIDRGHEAYLVDVDALDIDPAASYSAAIATAAHHVLVEIVAPAQVPGLDTSLGVTLAAIPDGTSKTEGITAGEAAAEAMIRARDDDGYLDPFDFDLGDQPGDWRPVTPTALDPDPWVANLDPFVIADPAQFGSAGPKALKSNAYARDFREVKLVGSLNSTVRTADQTNAAIFWQAAPTALFNRLMRDLAATHSLDAVDEARLLAAINLAAADGGISCWADKYYWDFWRPMAAIREAGTDGNPATVADPTWRPLFDPSTPTTPPLSTPPFPDHPSGHGCTSGAVLHTARIFFGTDDIAFDVHSSRFPGQPRHFDSFTDALEEIVDARVWGGIHFRTADIQGAKIGLKVARYHSNHAFRPVNH